MVYPWRTKYSGRDKTVPAMDDIRRQWELGILQQSYVHNQKQREHWGKNFDTTLHPYLLLTASEHTVYKSI